MSTYKTEGIIIKRNNFGESSLLLHICTKDYGKVEAVARSARKAKGKLKGHLELFLDTDLILARGRNIDTVTSSVAVESFLNLRNNLEFSFGVYYILELIDKMTIEEHRDERIFYLLKESLLFLDEMADKKLSLRGSRNDRGNPVATREELSYGIASSSCVPSARDHNDINCLILLFQINILNLTGFSPELNKCVFCGKPIKPGKNYFSFSMGGIVGQECVAIKFSPGRCESSLASEADASKGLRLPMPISDNTIKLLRLFQFKGKSLKEYNSHLKKSFQVIEKLKIDKNIVLDAIFLMNKFIEFNIERKVKGVDFLRGV